MANIILAVAKMPPEPPDSVQSEVPTSPALPLPDDGKPKLHARTKRFLKAQIQYRTFAELAMLGKFLAVGLVTVVPALLTLIVVSRAMVETGIVMTSLSVPQSLDALGYSSEISTQRLLDEITQLNKISVAAKPKTALGDTQLIDALSLIETPAGSLDLRSFQSLIRRVLGKKIIQISGEITTRKESGQEFLRLRLRQTPGREVLIDFETSRGPADLFKKAALNLLEHVDPEVAAGIYFRKFDDPENAMRLIAIALAGGHPGSEKYALNLQSYVFLSLGQIDDARNASDKARSLDPNFWAAYLSKVWVLMALKRRDEALEVAKFAVDLNPDDYNGYRNLGAVFKAMGRTDDAIEAFRKALGLNNRDVNAYRLLAATLRGEGRTKEASETLFTALALAPDDPQVQFDYGEDLLRRGRHHDALGVLCKIYETLPDNIRFQIACAEARFFEGQNAEGINLATTVKERISSGEKIPENLKARAESLTARIPQVDQQR